MIELKVANLADAAGDSFKPKVLAFLQEMYVGQTCSDPGYVCAFQYLVDQLAVPGKRDEFCHRFFMLTEAIRRLSEQGVIRLSWERLNPQVYLV